MDSLTKAGRHLLFRYVTQKIELWHWILKLYFVLGSHTDNELCTEYDIVKVKIFKKISFFETNSFFNVRYIMYVSLGPSTIYTNSVQAVQT